MKRTGRELFSVFKPILSALSIFLSLFPLRIRIYIFQLIRSLGGKIGMGLRYILIKSISKECGDNVSIHKDVYILNPENLRIGSNVSIHPFSYIDAKGEITVGNNVSIAHGVTIMSTTHSYKKMEIPIKYQEMKYKQTKIDDNVWVGAKSMIMAGINIDNGVIVGAMSVVTHDIESNLIVAGNPARKIKKRE